MSFWIKKENLKIFLCDREKILFREEEEEIKFVGMGKKKCEGG